MDWWLRRRRAIASNCEQLDEVAVIPAGDFLFGADAAFFGDVLAQEIEGEVAQGGQIGGAEDEPVALRLGRQIDVRAVDQFRSHAMNAIRRHRITHRLADHIERPGVYIKLVAARHRLVAIRKIFRRRCQFAIRAAIRRREFRLQYLPFDFHFIRLAILPVLQRRPRRIVAN